MRLSQAFLSIFLCGCLAGCTADTAPAPVVDYGASTGAGSAGVHIVKSGDTAYDIAKRYKVPLRDLLDKNRLYPPYDLNVGERLRLPPPNIYKVKDGDTLYSISRLFDVSMSNLAQKNALRAPYVIRPGNDLRLPYQGRGSVNRMATRSTGNAQSARKNPPNAKKANLRTRQIEPPQNLRPPKRSSSRFQWPVSGRVISRFGPKKGGLHNDGINIAMPRGAPVRAAENGVVLYTGDALKGYGNLVLVKHSGGWVTAYAHLEKILVKKGQKLGVGETLGTVGSSGQVDTPQLHFEIRKGSKALNPAKYLGKVA